MSDQQNQNPSVQRRVVCAANKHRTFGVLILGARHFDQLMHSQIEMLGYRRHPFDQGFIDQWGVFMDRKEAYQVAKNANQILQKTGNLNDETLYSEDLY